MIVGSHPLDWGRPSVRQDLLRLCLSPGLSFGLSLGLCFGLGRPFFCFQGLHAGIVPCLQLSQFVLGAFTFKFVDGFLEPLK